MPSTKKFGNTPWGEAWLEAFEYIDYDTNRLARGKSYARGGRVKDIKIDSKGIVTAKVKGSKTRPYKTEIQLDSLSPFDKADLIELISKDPSISSELSLGRIPDSLLPLLNAKEIDLFPTEWDDISSNCSCPDWANPCKHLAAVYYVLTEEIDKDPLLLFRLRGIDTVELMKSVGFSSNGNTSSDINQFVFDSPLFLSLDEINVHFKNEKNFSIDSNFNPDLTKFYDKKDNDRFFSLLSDKPLFYKKGNFKEVFLKSYKNIGNLTEKLEIVENGYNFKNVELNLLCPEISFIEKNTSKKKKNRSILSLYEFFVTPSKSVQDKKNFLSSLPFCEGKKAKFLKIPTQNEDTLLLTKRSGISVPLQNIVELFLSLPYGLTPSHSSPHADFLNLVVSLARALALTGSFAPVLRSLSLNQELDKNFYIFYKPLVRNENLALFIEKLYAISPVGFAFSPKDEKILPPSSVVEELLTLTLTYIVKKFSDMKYGEDDKIAKAFFRDEPYNIEKFEEKGTAKSISDWLAWLNLKPSDIVPALEINLPKPDKDKFNLRVRIKDKKSPMSPMLFLQEVFDEDKSLVFSLPIEKARRDVSLQLTVAGEYVPILKTLLKHKGRKTANLSSQSLSEFLSHGQHICSLLGIGVVLPKALKEIAVPRLSLAAKKKSGEKGAVSYLNLNEMLEFSYQISMGNTNIDVDDFIKLSQSTDGIIKFKDQYLFLKPEEISEIINKLQQPVPKLSAMETLRIAVLGEVSDYFFSGEKILSTLLDKLKESKSVTLPKDLNATLRPYQERGFYWLYNNYSNSLGSCLADDMGLGKTIQVISLLLKLKEENRLDNSALVICPATLIANWVKECQKFAPSLRVLVYHGFNRELSSKDVDVTITSYGMLRKDILKFRKVTWSLAVIDEAQNIKNPETDQTKAVKLINANGFVALSGTPIENRLMELWSIFDFTLKGYLGRRNEFSSRFALPIEKYKDLGQIEKLQKATAPFLLRRLKSDKAVIDDLPDKIVKEEYCNLTVEQAALYQNTVSAIMKDIESNEGIARKGLVFKLMTALKQICNHPVHYTKTGEPIIAHSGKAEKTLQLVESALDLGEKTLIFTQYREMGDILQTLLSDKLMCPVLFFHGGLSLPKREEFIQKFQNEADFPLMIVSLKAGGTGLNLTAATNVIHYDLWWNPAVEDQATDRTYRIGQTKTVLVHRLISLGTFEEKINEMMSAKRDLAEMTIASGEMGVSEMTNEQLKELFMFNVNAE